MIYIRFPVSLRNVEDLNRECGGDTSHESVRFWFQLGGQLLLESKYQEEPLRCCR